MIPAAPFSSLCSVIDSSFFSGTNNPGSMIKHLPAPGYHGVVYYRRDLDDAMALCPIDVRTNIWDQFIVELFTLAKEVNANSLYFSSDNGGKYGVYHLVLGEFLERRVAEQAAGYLAARVSTVLQVWGGSQFDDISPIIEVFQGYRGSQDTFVPEECKDDLKEALILGSKTV